MRVGLALPHYDYSFPDGKPLTWPRLVDAAHRAESLGFDSAWISDHFFLDLERYGGPADPQGTVEPFTALAGLATTTERVRLGTLVACAPFRHPAQVAKMATTIDLVSGGRFDLGIGAGWYEREFAGFAVEMGSPGERFELLEEAVDVITALFRGEKIDHDGRRYHLAEAYNRPLPAQEGGPPLWLGGKGGDRLLRLAARHGTGWNTVWRVDLDDYPGRTRALRAAYRAAGRDPSDVRLSVGLYTLVGEDERDLVDRYRALQRWMPGGALDGEPLEDFARNTLTGTVETCVKRLMALAELGVEEIVVGAAALPFAVYDWSMVEVVAEELIPAAHEL